MKKMITMSLIAAATTVAFASTAGDIANLQSQIDTLKTKQGKINAQSANDNIKWGVDFRTAYDNINYDMADGNSYGNSNLLSMRLWLNMAYAPDSHNIFKGQLSMNKAFGADFASPGNRTFSMGGMFDWTGNEALTDNSLKVRQAYWLYLGDNAFGADIPWTFSIGRRPSTNGFLANLSQDDAAGSPLGHLINVEFDGLSSKLDFSNITGVPGMTFKVCLGMGSTNAVPLFDMGTATRGPLPSYVDDAAGLDPITLAGFIFEPYNDGQYIVKTTYYKAIDLPGMDMVPTMGGTNPMNPSLSLSPTAFTQYGDMQGAGISVLVDGLTEEGYASDVKLFGSFAWTKSTVRDGNNPALAGTPAANPMTGEAPYSMFGSPEDQTGTSYWFGAYLPVGEGSEFGTVGLEYNHGSQYWRPFTYAEDTMIGSKVAARGDAWEANYTYQINDALSLQARYVNIDYDYTGSQGFFGNASGNSMNIDDLKDGSAAFYAMGGSVNAQGQAENLGVVTGALMAQGMDMQTAQQTAGQMAGAAIFLPGVVEKAQDFRLYLRYRF